MNSFQWDSCYETGIDEVDEQHQFLVDIINRYGALVAENTISMEDIRTILFELYQYSEFHFREEEALMRKSGIYSAHLDKHIKIHRANWLRLNVALILESLMKRKSAVQIAVLSRYLLR